MERLVLIVFGGIFVLSMALTTILFSYRDRAKRKNSGGEK